MSPATFSFHINLSFLTVDFASNTLMTLWPRITFPWTLLELYKVAHIRKSNDNHWETYPHVEEVVQRGKLVGVPIESCMCTHVYTLTLFNWTWYSQQKNPDSKWNLLHLLGIGLFSMALPLYRHNMNCFWQRHWDWFSWRRPGSLRWWLKKVNKIVGWNILVCTNGIQTWFCSTCEKIPPRWGPNFNQSCD